MQVTGDLGGGGIWKSSTGRLGDEE